ncbi:MAG TPA: uroporphyrinogen decarboxylase family protein [Candidatus Dormibacteraeota bacterium]
MDGRGRVEAAIAGREVDRPPVGAWGHTYKEEWSPEQLAAVTVERARRYGWDFVKFQPRATCFAEAFGGRWHPAGHRLKGPVLDLAPVHSAEDWKTVRLVDPKALDDQVRGIGLVAGELGDRVPVIQTVFSPISVAAYLAGKDKRQVVRDLRQHPDLVLPAFERMAEVLVDFSRRSVQAGAAGIFYAISGFASSRTMPLEAYRRLLLPLDQRLAAALPREAWFNVLHVCGSHVDLSIAAQLPFPVVSWSIHNQGNPGLAEGRRLSGGRAVMGGVAQRDTLIWGPAEEIARQVKAAEQEVDRGLLVAPGCSVPPRVREAHLAAMAEAA